MTFQLPIYTEGAQAAIDEYRERARKLHAFLSTKAEEPDYCHDNGKWAYVKTRDNVDNICATPVCALGWAVHQGICEGAAIEPVVFGVHTALKLGFSTEELKSRRRPYAHSVYDSGRAYFNVEVDDSTRANEITSALRQERSDIEAEVVIGGKMFSWSEIGEKFFGVVVTSQVFRYGGATLEMVLERLAQFAAHGYINVPVEEDELFRTPSVASTIYYHCEENLNDLRHYFIHLDGAEGDFQ